VSGLHTLKYSKKHILHQSLQKTDKIAPVSALHLSVSSPGLHTLKWSKEKESDQSLQKNGQDSSSFRVAPHSFSSFRFSECSKEQNVKIPPVSALRFTVSLPSGFHRLKCSKEENLHQSLQQIRQNSSNFSVAPRLKFETAGKSGNVRQFSVC